MEEKNQARDKVLVKADQTFDLVMESIMDSMQKIGRKTKPRKCKR